MFRDNPLKRKLAAGSKPVGCWVFMAGGDATELIARIGFDALIIDHEHIWASPSSLIGHMRAAQGTETTCLVRVPSQDPVYIKRVLDAGIEGIVVPTVETAEEARAIVSACRYTGPTAARAASATPRHGPPTGAWPSSTTRAATASGC